MPCRPTHMTLIYLINWILDRILILLASLDMDSISHNFSSWVLNAEIWNQISCCMTNVSIMYSFNHFPPIFFITQFTPLYWLWCQICPVFAEILDISLFSVVILSFLRRISLPTPGLLSHLCLMDSLVWILVTCWNHQCLVYLATFVFSLALWFGVLILFLSHFYLNPIEQKWFPWYSACRSPSDAHWKV